LRKVSGKAGVIKPCTGDVAVGETFSFTSTPANSEKNHLLVAHAVRHLKAENPDIAKLRGENLAALGQPVAGDDKHQNTAGFQPALRVAQECLLSAATVSRPKRPVVGWIAINTTQALDRTMHFQRIALNRVRNSLPGLVSTVGIKLDAVAKHLDAAGDCLEGDAVANARVNR